MKIKECHHHSRTKGGGGSLWGYYAVVSVGCRTSGCQVTGRKWGQTPADKNVYTILLPAKWNVKWDDKAEPQQVSLERPHKDYFYLLSLPFLLHCIFQRPPALKNMENTKEMRRKVCLRIFVRVSTIQEGNIIGLWSPQPKLGQKLSTLGWKLICCEEYIGTVLRRVQCGTSL
jgi:hypothetical protein